MQALQQSPKKVVYSMVIDLIYIYIHRPSIPCNVFHSKNNRING